MPPLAMVLVALGALVLGERVSPLTALAAACILAGLSIHVLGGRLAPFAPRETE